MNGHFTTEAIVLNSIDYGESDRIVTLYTLGFGKVRGIAKGAKRSRKRFVNKLEPFSYIKLLFFQKHGRGLVMIEQAETIRGFHGLLVDMERLALGSYCLELLNEMTMEGQKNQRAFELFLKFLIMLDGGADPKTIVMLFEMQILSILGYQPCLNMCVACKDVSTSGNKMFFSSTRSGILCVDCKGDERSLIPVSPGALKFLLLAARTDIYKAGRIAIGGWAAEECSRVLGDFLRYQIGKELKSKQFLEKISFKYQSSNIK